MKGAIIEESSHLTEKHELKGVAGLKIISFGKWLINNPSRLSPLFLYKPTSPHKSINLER